MTKLNEDQIKEALVRIPEWSEVSENIQRTVQFSGFAQAMRFANTVAELAEEADHHPDILIRYNKVTLTLSTHDAGGLTEKDFDLAERIDRARAATAGAA